MSTGMTPRRTPEVELAIEFDLLVMLVLLIRVFVFRKTNIQGFALALAITIFTEQTFVMHNTGKYLGIL